MHYTSRSLLALTLGALLLAPAALAADAASQAGASAANAFVPPKPILDLGPVAVEQHASTLSPDWVHGPFYEVYVRGFKDSNKDGTGDLRGLADKLDYIKSLGVTGIWLMPITHSDDNNHGYAVKNYRNIEPRYGKFDDLQYLLDEAHKRGIGVIIDYVMNHSADTHPLFLASAEGPKSPYRDWYVWADNAKPEGWSGFNGDSWYARNDAWFYAVFWERMPDFNLKNPKVVDWHMDNLRFWMNKGVDGFRFDAVSYLVENSSVGWENQPENYQIMQRAQKVLKEYNRPTYMVCEAATDAPGFAQETGCGSAFAFGLQKAILKSVQFGRYDRDLVAYIENNPVGRMGVFLSNHDSPFGLRVFKQVGGDLNEYHLAAATQMLIPGIPFTLYGEEIGEDVSSGAGGADETIRAPMSWTSEARYAGFTDLPNSQKYKLFRPTSDNADKFNVEVEDQDPNSLLNFYRQIIALRKSSQALVQGNFTKLDAMHEAPPEAGKKKKGKHKPVLEEDTNVFTFLREFNGEKVLVAINYSDKDQAVTIDLKTKAQTALAPLWPKDGASNSSNAKGTLPLTVPGNQFLVFKLN